MSHSNLKLRDRKFFQIAFFQAWNDWATCIFKFFFLKEGLNLSRTHDVDTLNLLLVDSVRDCMIL